jgi:peptidoglycan hydrolase-like protein with peptidoglycan-binding domain
MSRRTRISAIVLLAVIAAGGGVVVYAQRVRAGEPAPQVKALPTVPVTRGDLISSAQQPGQLGFSGSYQLIGQRSGTITAVPVAGQVIDRGQPVYAVDQRPVPLLFGSVPLYRELRVDVTGADVRQLERNLVDLGHAPGLTVDDRFTSATRAAVQRWQHALGVPETGVVEPGDAVVAPGPVRVASVRPLVGAAAEPGQPVAAATGTGHGVHVDLDRRYRALAAVDRAVRIQLFGGREVDGVISSVGTAAAPAQPAAGGQPSNQGNPAQQQTIDVDIRITGQDAELGGVFEGPVTVQFPGETRRGVLSIPVEALTALPGGGYAVVVVDQARRRTVPVTTGLITSARVEITGADIAEGVRVEVPTL